MTDLRGVQQTWESLAQTDPLWSICTDGKRRGGGWDAADFFATGEAEISKVVAHVAAIGLKPRMDGRALDFGCGVGRLTQALCNRFAGCAGVDISPTMIRLAREHNRHRDRCVYELNDADDLRRFSDGEFAFVYSSIVLQHMAPEYMKKYLREFGRVLEPGGVLVCQIPDYQRSRREKLALVRQRLGLRTRLKRLVGMRVTDGPAQINTGEMEMHWLEEREVRRVLSNGGCRVVDVRLTNSIRTDFNGELVYPDRAQSGMVSKQYCAVK